MSHVFNSRSTQKQPQRKKVSVIKKLFRNIERLFTDEFVQYTLILFSIFVVIMVVIFMFERDANENISSFFDVIWYALVTITTVGYGDISPSTVPGRIAGIFLLLFGVISFAAISGKVASVLFDRQLKKDRGLVNLKNISGHFIICGWKHGFDKIVAGIIASNPDLPKEKIVIINTASSEQMDIIKANPIFNGINYVSGDYIDEYVLIRANIKTADRILVLADYSQNYSPLEMDSRTVLATLTIVNLNPKIYRVVELMDPSFERHLQAAHCDEIILTSDYEKSLLISASTGIGLSHVLKSLLTEVSGHGLVIGDIPKKYFEKTYFDYKTSLNDSTKVLIGLLENTGNFFQRRKEALDEAQKNPNMQKIVKNLQKVKNLTSNEPVLTPPNDYVIKENSKAIFICGNRELYAKDSEGSHD